MDTTLKKFFAIIIGVLIFYLLQELSSIILPLVLAFLFASLFQPLVMFLKKKNLPKWLFVPMVALITLAVLFGITMVIIQTVGEVSAQQDFLIEKLNTKLTDIASWLDTLTGDYVKIDFESVSSLLDPATLSGIATDIASGFGSFTGSFIMFTVYYIVILFSLTDYDRFLRFVEGREDGKYLIYFERIQKSISSYMIVKIFVSILTAGIIYGICKIFGLQFAFFWAFLTFLLNFIPSIGSTIAVIFPTLMGIIQFDSFNTVIIMAALMTVTQLTIGNLVEPSLMGSRLRLNTLTVLFGLVFWGYMWGVPGMFLSVPLLVIMKLILEQFPEFSVFARLMGSPDKAVKANKE